MRILAIVLLGLAMFPGLALAGVESGSTSDPLDQPPALSGDATPDITGVSVSYDKGAGAISSTVTFAAPVSATTGYDLSVSLGTSDSTCADGMLLFTTMDSGIASVSLLSATGDVPVALVWSPDRSSLTMAATNPGLAGGAYNCASAATSLYDEIGHCGDTNCDYISNTTDIDDVAPFALSGPDVRPKTVATRLKLSATISRCRGEVDVFGADTGSDANVGRVKYILSGPRVHRAYSSGLLAGGADGPDFSHLRPGRYVLTARYTGATAKLDSGLPEVFSPSKVVTKRFTVKPCR